MAVAAVTASARSPRRALRSDPIGVFLSQEAGATRPVRALPTHPLRTVTQGARSGRNARTPPRMPRRFVWSPPRRVFRLVRSRSRFGRTYGCGSAPAFDRLPPLRDVSASLARDRNGAMNAVATPKPISVQLYTLRDRTAVDFPAVLARLGAKGYAGVELAGLSGLSAAQLTSALTAAGIGLSSAHIGLTVDGGFDAALDLHQSLGCDTVVIPSLPHDAFSNL